MKKLFLIALLFSSYSYAQEGEIHGDFQLNLQSYKDDARIGAIAPDEIILNNSFFNLMYSKGNFSTGVRYESYLNALLDYDSEFQGNSIAYRYASYSLDNLDVTVGNYYEQFGSGLVFRTYENKSLGVDNAMDGVRIKYNILNSIDIKSFIGKSRTHLEYSDGIIRGVDFETSLFELLALEKSTNLILGSSFVSRFQKDNNPKFNLPQNVGVYGLRTNFISGNFNYYLEYVHKYNDPAGSIADNSNNYATGNAIRTSLTYFQKGLGFSFDAHRVDNMEFRSERQQSKEYIINYIPTLSKQHSYTLLAFYPCATQSNGEIGFQSDLYYKFDRGTIFGGKYGTKININYSRVLALDGGSSLKNDSIDFTPVFLGSSNELFYSDLNLELVKKINSKLRVNSTIAFQKYNKDVLEGKLPGEYGIIESTIGVIDATYKLKRKHTLRAELQALLTDDDDGSWSMALVEYTMSPNWFFAIQDLYNFGNDDQKNHYFNFNFGYIKGSNRIEIGYGKKRAGIFCVGGVCKEVPSSNGFSLNISSSF